MLNYQDRVAEIAQCCQRIEQATIVSGVQTNRRLVQNVEHAAQLRSDLSGQTNSLSFTARQSCGRTVKRQVTEADRLEKAQARLDLSQNQSRDLFFSRIQFDLIEGFNCILDRHRRVVGNTTSADPHGERVRAQPSALTLMTHRRRNHLFQGDADFF